MGDLTKNFSKSELWCPHCKLLLIDKALIDGLQELRDKVGVPVTVTSAKRCRHYNHAVGGTPRSFHILGQAADIVIQGMDPLAMYQAATTVEAFRKGGIGLYPARRLDTGDMTTGFIHVDVRNAERPARWGRVDGEYVSVDKAIDMVEDQIADGVYS